MQKAVDSLILSSLLSVRQFAALHLGNARSSFYDHLLGQLIKGECSRRVFVDLGNLLIGLAEQAYGLRQVDKLEELSKALLELPLPKQ